MLGLIGEYHDGDALDIAVVKIHVFNLKIKKTLILGNDVISNK